MACIGIRRRGRWCWPLQGILALALLAGALRAEEATTKSQLRQVDGLLNRPPVSSAQAAKAEALLNEVIERDGATVEALLRLGIAQSLQEKYADSETTFNQALQLAPREPRLLHNLGMLLLRQKRYDEALAYFHQALEVRPWHPQSNFYIGVIHERRGQPEEALHYYIEELNVNPANPSAWRQYTQIREAQREGRRRGVPWNMLAIWLVVVAASATLYWFKKSFWEPGESAGFPADLEQ